MQQSKQLITFNDNKLVLSSNLELEKTKIITVIGRARLGKSSLLNIIYSYLTGSEQETFRSSSSVKHVTQGIHYYYYDKLNLLILDSQGLDYSDSSNDHKILLFCYSISDMIIYNDKNIFNNSSLNCLCQLSSFVNRIENINIKPILVIRIADYDLDDNIDDVIKITLEHQNDQYDNIRNAMTTLFSTIIGLQTNHLDKSDMINMKSHKYLDILKNKENNYEECIRKTLSLLDLVSFKKLTLNTLNTLIYNINNNININYMVLDIYTQISKTQILEFIISIPKFAYVMISVDGTQDDYEQVYMPRLLQYQNIMDDFDTKFKLLPDNIKKEYRIDIDNKLKEPLECAMKEIIMKATKLKLGILGDESKIKIGTLETLGVSNLGERAEALSRTFSNRVGEPNREVENFPGTHIFSLNSVVYKDITKIEQFYDYCIKKISHVYEPIVMEQRKIYDTSLIELKEQISKIDSEREVKISAIKKQIQEVSAIHVDNMYEENNIDIAKVLMDDHLLGYIERIILLLYRNKIDMIDTIIPDYKLTTYNSLCSIEKVKDIEFLSRQDINDTIINNITINLQQMILLKTLVQDSLYKFVKKLSEKNKYDHTVDMKLKDIYKAYSINAIKFIVSKTNYRFIWILEELEMKANVLFPDIYIHKKLEHIIKYSKINSNNIIIDYNTSAERQEQIVTYYIDCLYNSMMKEVIATIEK